MEPNRETIFLRTRFGFVKMALQTGAHLVPAFAFGQSSIFGYARPGPPLLPPSTPHFLSKARSTALEWLAAARSVADAAPARSAVARLCSHTILGALGHARTVRGARARGGWQAHPRAARRAARYALRTLGQSASR
jgi:hypothetical protein